MKTFFLILALALVSGCSIAHKRDTDPQLMIDYYLAHRGALTSELTKYVTLKSTQEAELTLRWTVNDLGQTEDVTIQNDTLQNEKINSLLMDHLKTLQFPKSSRFSKAMVEYTYKFHSNTAAQ